MTEATRLATYSCLHCGTERPYGAGNDTPTPLLNCVTCRTQTRHQFKENNEYNVTAQINGEGKIVMVEFQ